MAPAEVLLLMCLHASCSASALEGAKWKIDSPPSWTRIFSSSRRETADRWEKVTSVLEKAKENSTFPGAFLIIVRS